MMATWLIGRLALAAVCAAAATACAITYVSAVRLQDALVRFQHTADLGRALRDVRGSDSPLNPSGFRDAAIVLALLEVGHPAAAERSAAATVRREPDNAQTWFELARIQVSRKELPAARASWVRARRLNPHIPPALPAPIIPRKR